MTFPATGGPFRFLSPNPLKDYAYVPAHLSGQCPNSRHPAPGNHQPPDLRHPYSSRPALGIPAMLLALPCWFVASWCITIIDRGGPGWLNLLVLLATWNMLKFIVNGPITALLLFHAWTRDIFTRRRAHRVDQAARCDETALTHRND